MLVYLKCGSGSCFFIVSVYGPPRLYFEPLKLPNFPSNADPDPASKIMWIRIRNPAKTLRLKKGAKMSLWIAGVWKRSCLDVFINIHKLYTIILEYFSNASVWSISWTRTRTRIRQKNSHSFFQKGPTSLQDQKLNQYIILILPRIRIDAK
jgi:hypothetical protein